MGPLKLKSMSAYGLTAASSAYGLDHLIPIALGGAPSDIRNLWPQSRRSPPAFRRKNRLEASLRRRVCQGSIPLAAAQRRIVAWPGRASRPGGERSSPGAPAAETPAGPPSPPPEPPVEKSEDCFSDPSACGYPDPGTAGVPSGTSLASSKSIVAVVPGQVIAAKDVEGTIEVEADNVTIVNTRVTQDGDCGPVTPCGNYAIQIDDGVSGTVISHVETRTLPGRTCEHDIRNLEASTEIVGSYLHACDSNLYSVGAATMRDTYGISKLGISTDHVENIYFDDGAFTAIHDTLLNPVEQTAVVFGNVGGGGGGECSNHLRVEDSLLAGGGYTMYPCGNGTGPGTSTWTVKNNHFARCRTAEVEEEDHHLCSGGPDTHGYFPNSGSYGLYTYEYAPQTTWVGNVWDDDLTPIPAP
jgi:hypothetical protein